MPDASHNEKKGVFKMTNDIIKNDCQLNQYAESAARDIVDKIAGKALRENLLDVAAVIHGGEACDMAHEHADGSEHVIYYYKAHAICQNCDTENGEAFLEDIGGPGKDATYNSIATTIAFGELHSRILRALYEMGVTTS